MVRRRDIAGSWAYFLSLFDIFIYNINSTILMSKFGISCKVSVKVLMLLGIHVQTFEYATHVDEEVGRHLALV